MPAGDGLSHQPLAGKGTLGGWEKELEREGGKYFTKSPTEGKGSNKRKRPEAKSVGTGRGAKEKAGKKRRKKKDPKSPEITDKEGIR